MRFLPFHAAMSLALATACPGQASAAPDNLLGTFSDPLRLMHMYTAADGSTHIDETTLPARGGGMGADEVKVFIEGAARRVRLLAYKPGGDSPWHYAREIQNGSTGKVVLLLQGEMVVTLGEGRAVRVPAGTLMFNDDHAGQGHRTRCEVQGKDRYCLIFQFELEGADRLFPLPAAPKP